MAYVYGVCLLLPQISRVQKMLGDEYGTASNIKSRVNRLSVLGAITSAQQRLKLYNKVRLRLLLGLRVWVGCPTQQQGCSWYVRCELLLLNFYPAGQQHVWLS